MQYVFATIRGQLNETFSFTKKFTNNGTYIGFCLTKDCNSSQIQNLTQTFTSLALSNGYIKADIDFIQVTEIQDTNINPLIYFPLVLGIVSLIIGLFGTLIEFTQIGNRKDILIPVELTTLDYKEYNKQLLFQKEYWCLFFLSFSFIRNIFHHLSRRRKKDEYHIESERARKAMKNLDNFDGLKGFCIVHLCYAMSFYMTTYIEISNPEEFKEMQKTLGFILVVTGAYTSAEIFLFIAGLLQAISFLQKYPKPNCYDIFKFICNRFYKILIVYWLIMIFFTFGIREIGYGINWHLFDKVLKPCESQLWANILFINNFVPTNTFESEMCMPWTWFIANYMQLSILTPLIIYLLYRCRIFGIIFHIILGLGCLALQALTIARNDITQINPALNQQYWKDVYIKPWQHYPIQIGLGVTFGILFHSYVDRKIKLEKGEVHENSIGYTILRFIKKKTLMRFGLSFIGVFLWFSIELGIYFFSEYTQRKIGSIVVFGVLRSLVTIMGISLLLTPLMLSRSRLVKFVLSFRLFNLFSHLSFGIYLWYPIIMMCYYLNLDHMIEVTYFNMFYCMIGTMFFVFLCAYLTYLIFQAPLISLSKIYKEANQIKYGNTEFKFKFIKVPEKMY